MASSLERNFNRFSSGTSSLPVTFIDTVALWDDSLTEKKKKKEKLLPGVNDCSSFAIFMEKKRFPFSCLKLTWLFILCSLSARYVAYLQ